MYQASDAKGMIEYRRISRKTVNSKQESEDNEGEFHYVYNTYSTACQRQRGQGEWEGDIGHTQRLRAHNEERRTFNDRVSREGRWNWGAGTIMRKCMQSRSNGVCARVETHYSYIGYRYQ